MRSNAESLTIVDTGAGWPGNVWQIAMMCECIIIPTSLSWADLRPTVEFVREMDERKESSGSVTPHLIIVPNRIPPAQRDLSAILNLRPKCSSCPASLICRWSAKCLVSSKV